MSDLDQSPAGATAARPSSFGTKAILSPKVERWHKPAFIVFLLCWAANWVLLLLRIETVPQGIRVEEAFLVSATVTTLLGLGRRLPFQNVLTAGMLIASISTGILAVGAASGVPFGPFVYTDELGGRIFDTVPCLLPLLWVALIINGRGVARLIMRPWRKTNYYGFWVIGLTCLLVVLFDLSFEPFAVKVRSYWLWLVVRSPLSWHTAPWMNFLGWFMGALGILAFTIPWLINKQPVKQPMDYHPLIVWLLLNLWVMTGNAMHQLWSAVVLALIGNVVAAAYAIRGARW